MAALLAGSTDKKAIAKRDAAIAAMKEVRKRYEDNSRLGGGVTGGGGGTQQPITKAEYDKLPSGATFTAPDGSLRIKP